MNSTKLLLLTPLLLALAYLSFVGLMYVSQRALLFPGASKTPAPEYASWGKKISIETFDGESLHGLYSKGQPGKPTILFFLGNADRVRQLCVSRPDVGITGHRIAGDFVPRLSRIDRLAKRRSLLSDGITAFDWLAGRAEGGIVVLGQSLGSGVAVHTAGQRPAVGVILVSAYLSVLSLAQSYYPYLPIALLIRDPFRSDLKIAQVSQPKLLIHGRGDDIIPLSSGEALFRIAPEPKQMLIYDNSGHNDIWDDGMVGDVIRFVQALDNGAT